MPDAQYAVCSKCGRQSANKYTTANFDTLAKGAGWRKIGKGWQCPACKPKRKAK